MYIQNTCSFGGALGYAYHLLKATSLTAIYIYIYTCIYIYTHTYIYIHIYIHIYIFKMYLDHDKTSYSQVRSEDRSLQTGILWILWLYGLVDIHRYQGRYHVQDCSSGSFETFSSFFLKVESRIRGQKHLRARYPISDTFPVRSSLPDPFFFFEPEREWLDTTFTKMALLRHDFLVSLADLLWFSSVRLLSFGWEIYWQISIFHELIEGLNFLGHGFFGHLRMETWPMAMFQYTKIPLC